MYRKRLAQQVDAFDKADDLVRPQMADVVAAPVKLGKNVHEVFAIGLMGQEGSAELCQGVLEVSVLGAPGFRHPPSMLRVSLLLGHLAGTAVGFSGEFQSPRVTCFCGFTGLAVVGVHDRQRGTVVGCRDLHRRTMIRFRLCQCRTHLPASDQHTRRDAEQSNHCGNSGKVHDSHGAAPSASPVQLQTALELPGGAPTLAVGRRTGPPPPCWSKPPLPPPEGPGALAVGPWWCPASRGPGTTTEPSASRSQPGVCAAGEREEGRGVPREEQQGRHCPRTPEEDREEGRGQEDRSEEERAHRVEQYRYAPSTARQNVRSPSVTSWVGPLADQVRCSCAQPAMPPSLTAATSLSPVRTG